MPVATPLPFSYRQHQRLLMLRADMRSDASDEIILHRYSRAEVLRVGKDAQRAIHREREILRRAKALLGEMDEGE